MSFEAWLKEQGIDPAKLDENARSKMETIYTRYVSEGTTRPDDAAEMEKARAEAVKAERERITTIRSEADGLGLDPDVVARAEADGTTVEQFRAQVVEMLKKRAKEQQDTPIGRVHIQSHTAPETADNWRAAEAALCLRGGESEESIAKRFGEPTVDLARKARGVALMDLMRMSLRASGEQVSDLEGRDTLIRRALKLHARGESTYTLPNLLGNVAQKFLLAGYESAPDTWSMWVDIRPINDFKAITIGRPSFGGNMDMVGKNQKLHQGKGEEETESARAYTYGEVMNISREDMINDDTGAFTRVPRDMGWDSMSKQGDLIYTQLIGNAVSSDAKTFWGTDHANYEDGTDSNLASNTTGAVNAAVAAMRKQKDKLGRTANLAPKYLLCPPALEASARALYVSTHAPDGGSTKKVPDMNIWGNAFQPVIDARLSNTTTFGANALATQWYLVADPRSAPAVVAGFINGSRMPIMESQESDFETLGMRFRVYFDMLAKAVDWRGVVANKGA